jgi:anti-repressor protein
MNHIQMFDFKNQNVRIVDKDGEPWFVLKDVCLALNIDQTAGIKRRLTDDVISSHPIPDALGRGQDTIIINEDGLYDVILESRKPEAKIFRKWVTRDVLPLIRKTGTYSLAKQVVPVVELRDKQKELQASVRRMNAETKLLQAKTDQGKVIANLMIELKEQLSKEDLHILVRSFVDELRENQLRLPHPSKLLEIRLQLKQMVFISSGQQLSETEELQLVKEYLRGWGDATKS